MTVFERVSDDVASGVIRLYRAALQVNPNAAAEIAAAYEAGKIDHNEAAGCFLSVCQRRRWRRWLNRPLPE
jgi:hypothetical protein